MGAGDEGNAFDKKQYQKELKKEAKLDEIAKGRYGYYFSQLTTEQKKRVLRVYDSL